MKEIESLKSVEILRKGHNIFESSVIANRPYYGIFFSVMDEEDKLYIELKYKDGLKKL